MYYFILIKLSDHNELINNYYDQENCAKRTICCRIILETLDD